MAQPARAPARTAAAATIRRLERRHGHARHRRDRADGRDPALVPRDAGRRTGRGSDLVAQAGIAAFVEWFRAPRRATQAITADVFGTAPRELTRAVTLQQTVELVRVAIAVVEEHIDEWLAPATRPSVREAVLRYSREIAFAAAEVYAQAAEARGAWDARLEALVVDALLRGEVDESLRSRAAALGWGARPVVVVAGTAPPRRAGDGRRRDPPRRTGTPTSTCSPACRATGWSRSSAARPTR